MSKTQSNSQKIVLMVGDGLRHQYFFRQLNSRHPIAAVLIQSSNYPEPTAKSKEEENAWNWFFSRRENFEKDSLTPSLKLKPLNKPDIINLENNELNTMDTLSLIKKYAPGFIAVFGTGIIKEDNQFLL